MGPDDVIEGFRLSPQQRRAWAVDGAAGAHRATAELHLTGGLDPERLRAALREVARDHEILRTRFEILSGMESPLQVIEPDGVETGVGGGPRLEVADLRATAAGAVAEAVEEVRRTLASVPLDPRRGGLVALALAALPEEDGVPVHRLLVSAHPLAADEASLGLLLAELGRRLGARPAAGTDDEEAPAQYVDVSEWQNDLLETEDGADGRAYWQERLAALPAPAEDAAAEGADVAAAEVELPSAVRDRLAALPPVAAAAGGGPEAGDPPLEAVLAAALAILEARTFDRDRAVVETAFDGRGVADLAQVLGPLRRFLPVAVRLADGRTVEAAVGEIAEALADHEPWQDLYPPERAEAAAREPGLRVPRVQVVEWPETVASAFEAAGIGARLESLGPAEGPVGAAPSVLAVRAAGELRLTLRQRDRAAAVELQAERFAALVGVVSEAVEPRTKAAGGRLLGTIEAPAPEERRRLLDEWAGTAAPVPGGTTVPARIVEHLRAAAREAPERPVLLGGGEAVTAAELLERSGRLASLLRDLGAGPERRVGLCLERAERAVDLVVGLLGIWRAGAAYVPLDPALPAARLRFLLDDTRAVALVTSSALAESLDLGDSTGVAVVALDRDRQRLAAADPEPAPLPPEVEADGERLAYVLYTSGSTGRPKGVMVRHGALVNLLLALDEAVYRPVFGDPGDGEEPLRVGVNASLGFDASVKQLIQLASGRPLVLLTDAERLDAAALLETVRHRAVDVLDVTPTQLRLLRAAGLEEAPERAPRLLLVGGEPIDAETRRWLEGPLHAAGRRAADVYGPTECTVDVTAAVIAAGQEPSLGRPLGNVRAHVVDTALRLMPGGAEGELAVGGAGLARGYLDRPSLTAERFVPDPFGGDGERLYRTGDRVRWLADGTLRFLGRSDHQVKLRGVRIELGEIASLLAEHPGVREAVVDLRSGDAAEARLVAWVVPEPRWAPKVGGRGRHALPNGLAVVEQNRNETEYLYQEIFEDRTYLRHGIELPEDARVVDVGANIGMFSLLVARHRPAARIWAFEPVAPIFDTLRANIALSAPAGAHVELLDHGLAAAEATDTFTYYPRYTMMSGLAAYAVPEEEAEVVKTFLGNLRERGDDQAAELAAHADDLLAGRFEGTAVDVRLRRLSDVVRERGIDRIDLLKIDVQRAEMDVLQGLDDGDWELVGQVVMEIHDPAGPASDGPIRAMTALLEERGFAVHTEQDALLAGTDRHTLYAVRPTSDRRLRVGAPPSLPAPEPAAAEVLSAGAAREHLRARLPDMMIPAAFVFLDALPVNASGKLDRRALPAPESVRPEDRADFVPPSNDAEATVAAVWQRVLGVERVGIHSNFFDLGGHSLLLVQVHGALREAFDRELSMLDLFERPTVAAMAALLSGTDDGGAREAADLVEEADEEARRQVEAINRRRRRIAEAEEAGR